MMPTSSSLNDYLVYAAHLDYDVSLLYNSFF